jgi:hypothetical protein
MTWAEVDQARRMTKRHDTRAPVRMALIQNNQRAVLWMTFSQSLIQTLGWQVGATIGLAVGKHKSEGWLRLSPSGNGQKLSLIGKNRDIFTLRLDPPTPWHGFTCDSTVCEEHRIQGDALLIQIPWDFSEIETGTGPAGHEVHS